MDIEQKQAEHIEHFVKQASIIKGSSSSLAKVIVEATTHPSLFAFTEILSVPNLLELQGTEHSTYFSLLQTFAYGTWSEYKSNASKLPQLMPDQVLKLKQLTMLTLADGNKVLPYDVLMHELDVVNVRELEDFLINECMYVGIVRGKLDQQRRFFEVQFAAGRDLRPGQLGNMIHTLSDWLVTSDSLLITIQEKIKWADTMSKLDRKHKKENEEKLEEVKNALSLRADMDFRGHGYFTEPGGVMDYDEDRRSKRGGKMGMSVWFEKRVKKGNLLCEAQNGSGDDIQWAEEGQKDLYIMRIVGQANEFGLLRGMNFVKTLDRGFYRPTPDY